MNTINAGIYLYGVYKNWGSQDRGFDETQLRAMYQILLQLLQTGMERATEQRPPVTRHLMNLDD